jgi:hypothetical protein
MRGLTIKPYLIDDSMYPIRTYLMKNYRSKNVVDVYHEDKKQFDRAMNRRRVAIENAFAALKDRWKILKNFPNKVDKAVAKTLACCIHHNFCEMRKLPLLPSTSTEGNKDMLMGFHNAIPHSADGRAAKEASKTIKDDLFAGWRINNPPLLPLQ